MIQECFCFFLKRFKHGFYIHINRRLSINNVLLPTKFLFFKLIPTKKMTFNDEFYR